MTTTTQDADLDDMLMVRHLSPRADGESLRQAIDRIINWEVMVNLDPDVSSAAEALVDKGRAEALLSVIQRLNQNPYNLTKSECIHVVDLMRAEAQGGYLAQGLDRDQTEAGCRDRLRQILDVVRKYLPPDGIPKDAALGEIIGLLDPWGVGLDAAVKPASDQLLVFKAAPIDMVLHCPACGMQHIDEPEDGVGEFAVGADGAYRTRWTNPPHRSHLCRGCGHIWRPADVPTNGVAAVKTKGLADSKIEKGSLRPWPALSDIAPVEPVAVVMPGWSIAWAGVEPIATLLARHPDVRIGTKLYTKADL